MKKVTAQTFEDQVIQSKLPVLVDFNAPWCGPCKKLAPILHDLAAAFVGKIDFVEVDAQTDPDIAQKYGVMSLPTIIIFKDGSENSRLVGLASKEKITERLNLLV